MKFFMKMWKDPVWSKVIATVIIGVVVYFVPYLSNWFPHLRVFITSAWEQGISIYDIAIPIFFAFLTSIFSSILSEFLIVTKVFIKFRKTIFYLISRNSIMEMDYIMEFNKFKLK